MTMAMTSASLITNPRLSQWIHHLPNGRFELRVGKVELGQGILTALKQIAMEELCVGEAAVVLAEQCTLLVPNEGLTAGSMSIQHSGDAVRRACRQLRKMFLEAASSATAIPVADLKVSDGNVIDGSGQTVTSYASMRGRVDFDVNVDTTEEIGRVRESDGAADTSALLRVDLPDKVCGRPSFIQDLELPGVLHARVIRPMLHDAQLSAQSEAVLAKVSDKVLVHRDGDFLALLSDSEGTVHVEAAKLAGLLSWEANAQMPPNAPMLAEWLRQQPKETTVIHDVASADIAHKESQQFKSTFSRPYIAHASIAPSCALACWHNGKLDVWTHSQSIFHLRGALAETFDLDATAIVVHHVQSAGCYGHNGADDAAFDAALLAMGTAGRPVRVLWSRENELGSSPVGAAMTADVSARMRADGSVSDWSYEVWSNGFLGRPGYSGLPAFLGDSHRAGRGSMRPSADARREGGYGIARNAIPAYDTDGARITQHRLLTMPIRTSSLRCLGAHLNVFAIESFMDEMAAAGGFDPVAFRLAKLQDERAKQVIQRAADQAGWGAPKTEECFGRGIAYARYKNVSAYCAVVAEVDASESLKVRRLVIVVDAGRVVNLDGVLNQVEGGAFQAVSWALTEEVKFDETGITSIDWEQYPILRFSEMPQVEASVLDRPDAPSLGVGECVNGPVAAAIANALHDALGVRVRHMPLNNDNIVRAIEDAPEVGATKACTQ
jgi:nicotinate dehydrogenase subunit B